MTVCLLIFGGRSQEHGASVHTAVTLAKYFKNDKDFEMVPLYISREGILFLPSIDDLALIPNKYDTDLSIIKQFEARMVVTNQVLEVITMNGEKKIKPDIAYPIIPGATGESGEVYGFLEFIHFPTIGPIMDMSITFFDKPRTKLFAKTLGIPTLPHVDVSVGQFNRNEIPWGRIWELGPKWVIKPSRQGSSIGLTLCVEKGRMFNAIESALCFDNSVLVEPYLDMLEHCCYVWATNSGTHVTELLATKPNGPVYDFKQKYIEKSNVTFIFDGFDAGLTAIIKKYSKEIYEQAGGSGIWRFDFFVSKEGIFLNEVNTVPAMINAYENRHPINRAGRNIGDVIRAVILHRLP